MPFQGLVWLEGALFPGRCPGLSQGAPLGRARAGGAPISSCRVRVYATTLVVHNDRPNHPRPNGASGDSPGQRPGKEPRNLAKP